MLVPTIFFICLGVVLAVPMTPEPILYDLEEAETLFESFKKTYNRMYEDEYENQMRFEIFKEKLIKINQNNKNVMKEGGAVLGINKFTDLTKEEFKQKYTGFKYEESNDRSPKCIEPHIIDADVPDSFDWRDQNVVSRVKNQESCGSCWAFSTIGNVESQYAIKYKNVVEFSEQQLVDCATDDFGCDGGFMKQAIDYLIKAGGAETEQDYQYTAKAGSCQFNASAVKARVTEVKEFTGVNEDKLKSVLYQTGPISLALYVSDSFQGYNGGILNIRQCPTKTGALHAVLLVGYGAENGNSYWIIKNSWGESWGESGFIRLTRGENTCGLMNVQLVSSVVA